MASRFTVRFWGVRGTIPCPAASHMGFGGNTSCVEVCVGGERIALDAGTGFRLLGKQLLCDGAERATLLLSHTHLDHIHGFPFFAPAFKPGFGLRVIAGHLRGGLNGMPDIRTVLSRQMESPLFPVPMKTMGANMEFVEIRSGERFTLGAGVQVESAPLNHPNGATGYRITYAERSLAYVTDTEHVDGQPDENVLRLIDHADVVIYDSTYTDDEIVCKRGWGHSTWREGTKLMALAQAGRLILFHHEPDHDDAKMAAIEAEAQAIWPNTVAAREGTEFSLV